MGMFLRLLALAVCGLALIGCSGTGGPSASDTSDQATISSSEPGDLSASTIDKPAPLPDPTTTTTAMTSSSSTTSASSSPSSSSTLPLSTTGTTATTIGTTTEPPPTQVFQPGNSGSFTSPSGNIACVMSADGGASCYIGEQSWTIEQPTGPFCEESDWGSAVDVTSSGVVFPCYTDLSWDLNAPVLAYGDRMEVGAFGCTSRESGVTCDNGTDGFEVARRQVTIIVL